MRDAWRHYQVHHQQHALWQIAKQKNRNINASLEVRYTAKRSLLFWFIADVLTNTANLATRRQHSGGAWACSQESSTLDSKAQRSTAEAQSFAQMGYSTAGELLLSSAMVTVVPGMECPGIVNCSVRHSHVSLAHHSEHGGLEGGIFCPIGVHHVLEVAALQAATQPLTVRVTPQQHFCSH